MESSAPTILCLVNVAPTTSDLLLRTVSLRQSSEPRYFVGSPIIELGHATTLLSSMDPSAGAPATPTRKRRADSPMTSDLRPDTIGEGLGADEPALKCTRKNVCVSETVASTPDTAAPDDTPATPGFRPVTPVPDFRPRVRKPFNPSDMFPPRYGVPYGLCGPSRILKGTYAGAVDSPIRPPRHLQHRVGLDFCEEVTRIQQEIADMANDMFQCPGDSTENPEETAGGTNDIAQDRDENAENPEVVVARGPPAAESGSSTAQNTALIHQPANVSTYVANEDRWTDSNWYHGSDWYSGPWSRGDWNYGYNTWNSGNSAWDNREWKWDYGESSDWYSWNWETHTAGGHWTKTPEGAWEWVEEKRCPNTDEK